MRLLRSGLGLGLAVGVWLLMWHTASTSSPGSSASGPSPTGRQTSPVPAGKPPALLSIGVLSGGGQRSGLSTTAPSPPAGSPIDRFGEWADGFLSGSGRASGALVSEGRALARARRAVLEQEIRSNPRAALAHAAPWIWRQRLPAEVTEFFEEAVQGRGRLDVYWAAPAPGPEAAELPGGKVRYLTMGDRVWRAYVYGRRLRQTSREGIAFYGIAIGNSLAVHEAPLRELTPEESLVQRALREGGHSPVCVVCGKPVGADGVVAQRGGELLWFCGRSHEQELNRGLMAAEDAPPADLPGTMPPPDNPSSSLGTKRVLYLRVVFRDDTLVPISEQEALRVMKQVNDFYVEGSYGKTALITTVSSVLTLANPKLFYDATGPGTILADAKLAAVAAGLVPEDYDLLLIRHPKVPSFAWGGLGGGGVAWLQSSGVGVAVHEIGHNYGLAHANFWQTRRDLLPGNPAGDLYDVSSLVGRDSVIAAGDDLEYGDLFDVMGSGGGGIAPDASNQAIAQLGAEFNVAGKALLGWLPEAAIADGDQGGRFRLRVFDGPTLEDGQIYAVRVRKDDQRTYWLSARSRIANRWLRNGVLLHWGGWEQALGYSSLLDTTPGSRNGRTDAAITVGRTYSDPESEIHITPVARGGAGPETWYDVVVNRGPFPLNQPPTAELTATAPRVAPGEPVELSVVAEDADGDELAYFWDFGDDTFAPNAPRVTRTWTTPGDRVVRCEVSDLKGGRWVGHLVVTVGAPTGRRLSGRVLDSDDRPLVGAWVSNGRLTPAPDYDYATNYQMCVTDSEGRFTFANLAPGAYPVTAYLTGYQVRPVSFLDVVLITDQDADAVDFLATPLPLVTVEATADADPASGQSGNFRLTRTGDTNTALRVVFKLGGSAAPDADYPAFTNLVTHTNVVPTPFGPTTLTIPFNYVDFATGIFETNLTIEPLLTAPPAEDLSVVLTLMHTLEAEVITGMTNTNYIYFTGWEQRPDAGRDAWFQTVPDYHLRHPAEATMRLIGEPPTQPVISVFALDASASENARDVAEFTFVRSGLKSVPVEVAFELQGTAEEGSDFEPLPRLVRFASGATTASVIVVAREDRFLEGNETVSLHLLPGADYGLGQDTAEVTIVDDDLSLVTVAATDPVATEQPGDLGTFTFTRIGDLGHDLEVRYLLSGSAVNGLDYRALPGVIIIPAGQPTATLDLTPRDNRELDRGKTAELHLADNPLYNVGWPATAVVRIQDSSLPTLELQVDDDTAAEPNDTAQFTLRRNGDASGFLTVRLEVGGTAQPLADYVDIPQEVRLLPGVTALRLIVTPVNDRFREDPETIIVHLLPGAGYNVGPAWQGQATLNDDDSGAPPAVGFNFLRSAGPEGAGQAQVAVSLSANPAENQDVTVDFAVPGGTALPDVDYDALSSTGRLVFPHNPSSGKDAFTNRTQLISVPLFDNLDLQPDRTMLFALIEPLMTYSNQVVTNDLTLTNAVGDVIQTNEVVTNLVDITPPMNARFDVYDTHTFTILDDDAAEVTLSVLQDTGWETGVQPAVLELRRDGATNRDQTVELHFAGLAGNGVDYQWLDTRQVIPEGTEAIQLAIIPVDDPAQEFMEDVRVTLVNAPGARLGNPASAIVQIVDNDGAVEFTRTAFQATEGAEPAVIDVRRTGDTNLSRQVAWLVEPDTALAGEDFLPTNGVLRFAPGEVLHQFNLPLVNDDQVEPEERARLTLRSLDDGAPLGGQSFAELRIRDDDSLFRFLTNHWIVAENGGPAGITVVRSGVINAAARVSVVTSNLVAVAGEDYVATDQLLEFAPGQTIATLDVPVLDDLLLEGDETLTLTLHDPEGGSVVTGGESAPLEILDDECALEFEVAEVEVEEYARQAWVNVVRRGGALNPVLVNFSTADGTARAGLDYERASGPLSLAGAVLDSPAAGAPLVLLAAGETNRQVALRILDDPDGEGHEEFVVRLANVRVPGGAALAGSATLGARTNLTVRILDNELPGGIDFEFNPGQGADAPVLAVAVQADGKILLGGEFTRVDGILLNHIARLHADGYLDTFLTPGEGTDGPVHAIAVQLDGRILLGGDFTTFRGQPAPRLVRLNADGTVDPDFTPGDGPNGVVRVIQAAPDGSLLVGGDFQRIRGVARPHLARLNPDGALVSGFNPRVDGPVLAIALQPDGAVLIGGAFANVGDVSRPGIARLTPDGALDEGFTPGEGADGPVRALAFQADGGVVLGGDFTHVSGTARPYLARLLPDGTLDGAFGAQSAPDGPVLALGLQPDGKLLAGGAFTAFGGVPRARYARLESDGALDPGFDIGAGADDTVRALAVQPNTALVIGGDFTQINGVPRRGIARIHGDDRFRPNTLQFAAANYRVGENAGPATIQVSRSGDLTLPVLVDALTRAGSATAGEDYEETAVTVRFDSGQKSAEFTVPILDDAIAEGDETVQLLLTNLPPGFLTVARLRAVLTIEDNEGAIGFSAARFEARESDGQARLIVRRTGPLSEPASVDYELADGEAIAGGDYVAAAGTLDFAPGVTERFIDVALINDEEAEPEETLTARLFNPTGPVALGSQSETILAIQDDDQVEFYSLNVLPVLGGRVTPPSGFYPAGSVQELAALPERDYVFLGWSGTVTGTDNPLTVLMDRNHTAEAHFEPVRFTEDFEPPFAAVDLDHSPWTNDARIPWRWVRADRPEATWAVRSGPAGDGKASQLELRAFSDGGTAAFRFRVNSEANWDFFEFFLDGRRLQRWSGDVPWQWFLFTLPPGDHLLAWRYAKDANFSAGQDGAFLDDLYLPPAGAPDSTAPQLAVVGFDGATLQIEVTGDAAPAWVIESSADLRTWTPFLTNAPGLGPFRFTATPSAEEAARYYRAIVP